MNDVGIGSKVESRFRLPMLLLLASPPETSRDETDEAQGYVNHIYLVYLDDMELFTF